MQEVVLQKEHFSLRNHISLFIPSGLSCIFGAFSGPDDLKCTGDSKQNHSDFVLWFLGPIYLSNQVHMSM